jgi:mRNA interferase HicA
LAAYHIDLCPGRYAYVAEALLGQMTEQRINRDRSKTHLQNYNTSVIYREPSLDAKELKKWLARQGCTFEGKRSGSGHLIVINPFNGRRSELPMHSRKELGKDLVRTIKKQLGLEDR